MSVCVHGLFSQERGLLLVTPEHRLSLELKWHECNAQQHTEICKQLDTLSAYPYLDLIDESDEALSNR